MIKKTFLAVVLLGILSPFAVVAYYYFAYNYDISSLVNYKPAQTSRIYDKNDE